MQCPRLHTRRRGRPAAAPHQPVPAHDRRDRDGWHGKKHPGDSVQFGTGQNADDNREWMQFKASANQSRVDHVVFDHTH